MFNVIWHWKIMSKRSTSAFHAIQTFFKNQVKLMTEKNIDINNFS